jgi:hypothetical protein
MKATPILAALILAGAAVSGFAQTPPPTDDSRQDASEPAAMPQTAEQAKRDVDNQKQDPLAMQSSAAQDWNTLTGHDKGYVTRSDALPNSWLATNFSNCDKDQDGKVSQAEYDKCKKKQE